MNNMNASMNNMMADPMLTDPTMADPLNNDYFVEEDYIYATYGGRELKDKDIKQIVGAAISQVDGVLGLKGGLTDVFKKDEDLTRGISVSVSRSNNKVKVSAKIITDITKSDAEVLSEVTQRVTDALQREAGLVPEKVDIEIADSMTRDEFYDKYNVDRAIN